MGVLLDTLTGFNKAVQEKSFAKFHEERLSSQFRKQHSLEKFTAAFQVFIDKGYDLSNIAQTKKGGGPGYARTLTVFVPKLRAAGASDEVLRQIMQDNPRRFLAFVPKKPRKA